MYRPDCPPVWARRVINALGKLTEGEKRVWIEIHILDRGPEGCYTRPDNFARRLGLARDTIEKARRRLKAVGLAHNLPNQGYTDRWYATLPAGYELNGHGPKDPKVFALAEQLDSYIRDQLERKETPQPGGSPAAKFVEDLVENVADQYAPSSVQPGGRTSANPPQPGGRASPNLADADPPPIKGVSTEKERSKTSALTTPTENGGATTQRLRTDDGEPLEADPESGRLVRVKPAQGAS